MTVTFEDIKQAKILVDDSSLVRTPFMFSRRLSSQTGANIYIKYENLQRTNSFKSRGAFVKLVSLTQEERDAGIIALSAGNHAQAVAYHSERMGIKATIVMPTTTPFIKVEQSEAYGARVVLRGETLVECEVATNELMEKERLTLVHPFDDDKVIAGQGTIAIEMLEDVPNLDTIVVPVGGGGLIAGIAVAAKAMKPDIEIIGVEPGIYPTMRNALNGIIVDCHGHTLAEGIAVKNVVKRTVDIVREHVSSIIVVEEDEIEQAVNQLIINLKNVAEGAGAVGLAAVMQQKQRFKDKNVGIVISGGNIDSRILASILFRELERSNRIINLRVEVFDKPGVLAEISTLTGDMGANILDVSHKRSFLDVPAKGALLDLTLETRDAQHASEIITAIKLAGYKVTNLEMKA
ncbi:MAG: threonine ammonia-lyase [Rhizobiales bacterium]|nr:threonine ammonia-lyase [Hyphomicrobiales bacterium]